MWNVSPEDSARSAWDDEQFADYVASSEYERAQYEAWAERRRLDGEDWSEAAYVDWIESNLPDYA